LPFTSDNSGGRDTPGINLAISPSNSPPTFGSVPFGLVQAVNLILRFSSPVNLKVVSKLLYGLSNSTVCSTSVSFDFVILST
jgi:hypothetical protein